jgi:hypothetical protein
MPDAPSLNRPLNQGWETTTEIQPSQGDLSTPVRHLSPPECGTLTLSLTTESVSSLVADPGDIDQRIRRSDPRATCRLLPDQTRLGVRRTRPHFSRRTAGEVLRLGILAQANVSTDSVLRNRGVWFFWCPASLQNRHELRLVRTPRTGNAGKDRPGGSQCPEWRTPLIHRLKGSVPRSYPYCRAAQASPSGPATAIFPTISSVFKSITATYPSRPQAA